jgi:hypothetical protein
MNFWHLCANEGCERAAQGSATGTCCIGCPRSHIGACDADQKGDPSFRRMVMAKPVLPGILSEREARNERAFRWCAERGASVTFISVHATPRVQVRLSGGAVQTERNTFLEAVESAMAVDARRQVARSIAV